MSFPKVDTWFLDELFNPFKDQSYLEDTRVVLMQKKTERRKYLKPVLASSEIGKEWTRHAGILRKLSGRPTPRPTYALMGLAHLYCGDSVRHGLAGALPKGRPTENSNVTNVFPKDGC